MNSLFFSVILILLTSTSFGADNCSQIQKNCNSLKVKYASTIKSWEAISFNTTPSDISAAEDQWHSCLKVKKENGCYKKQF